jgi:predicted enzyme related to lactoylglutathione lyase
VREVDRYPPGVPCWIEARVADPQAAAVFYGSLFGWTLAVGGGGRMVARLDGHDVAGMTAAPDAGGWTTFVCVDDAGRASERAVAAGGRALGPVEEAPPVARTALVADPSGAILGLWEPVEHGGAQLVNEPGTWNWSNLGTSDPVAATSYYGAVFGWEAMPMGEGVSLLRRPGYGDVLAERDPGLRARHDEAGQPSGFSDAIGWLVPVSATMPPGWSVTFAVDDTDAVAARAGALGGAVVAAPREEGPARVADLADPQGASFTVSRWYG